jgi:uncharacterized protein
MHLRSDPLLSYDDRRKLLKRARQAIFEVVSSSTFLDLPPAVGRLAEFRGVFVTLRSNGKLRGCAGQPDATHVLEESVVQCAITAALRDQRFAPLCAEEVLGLEIEISVLSKQWSVRPEEVEIGTHGIVITRGSSRSLLLPQMALERNWSVNQFLEAACRKARMEAGAWQNPGTNLYAFTAEIFSDASDFSAEAQSLAKRQ